MKHCSWRNIGLAFKVRGVLGGLRSVCVAGPVAGACSSLEPLRSTREMGRNGLKGIESKNSGFKQKRGFCGRQLPGG